MRVGLTTIGSDGDVQPFLALAKGLIAAGHDVHLAAAERYAARAVKLGVPYVRVGDSWDDRVGERFARVFTEKNPVRQFMITVETFKPELIKMVPEMMQEARWADVIVSLPTNIAAVAAAQVVGKPYIGAHLTTLLVRSRNLNILGSDLGRVGNALVGALVRRMTRHFADEPLNEVVRAAGLEPWHDIVMEASHSRLLNLLAVSPLVVPRDPLWPEHYVSTGYWYLDEPDYTLDPALAEFVEREPPIVITFGSMPTDARAVTAKLIDGVRDIGRRVVLQAGWAGLGEGELPGNVMRVGFVPHGWLFPRAACVVHHGGAGTTAAALRAGVPQLIVWHLNDQPAWGAIVRRLGVGPKGRAHDSFDGRWLRRSIDQVLGEKAMAERARALGEKIRQENGVKSAVRAIEAACG